jgi:hypothetical protein
LQGSAARRIRAARSTARAHDRGVTSPRLAALTTLATLAIACNVTAPAAHFENDYAAARQVASQRNLPLAVEVWAPW